MTINAPLPSQIPTKRVELFGGAITTQVPESFVDASNFREVPDNQEVYVSMVDGTDISVIVDLLQRVEASSEEAAVKVHFDDVVVDRPGKVFEIQSTQLPNFEGFPIYSLIGTVSANPTARNAVETAEPTPYTALLITIIRLAEKKTDIVVTVNVPFLNNDAWLEEGRVAAPGYTGVLDNQKTSQWLDAGLAVRDKVLQTLNIHDWSLFVDE